MNFKALPLILLTGFLLGTNLIVSRVVLDQFHPLTYVGLRLMVASSAFLSIYIFNRRRSWPTDWRLWGHATVIGIIGTTIPMVALVSALQYQSSGLTAVLVSLCPALTVLLAHFFFADESLNLLKGAGVTLTLGGALLLALRGESGLPDVSQASPIGYGLTFISLISISGITIYMRKFMRGYDSFNVTGIQIFVATLIVMPLSLLFTQTEWQHVSWTNYGLTIYTGLAGTFGAYMLYFYCVKRFGASQAAMVDYVAPVIASLGGVFLLGEHFTPGMIVGVTIIVIGIMLINSKKREIQT